MKLIGIGAAIALALAVLSPFAARSAAAAAAASPITKEQRARGMADTPARAPHDVAVVGCFTAVEDQVECLGNADRTFNGEARTSFREVAHETADHRAISAEGNSRNFVRFSALRCSSTSFNNCRW